MPISQHELRSHIRQLVPGRLREWLASGRLRELRRHNQGRSAQEIFSEIYEQCRWGTGDSFDSGSGSRGVAAQSYVELIRRLIRDNNLRTAR